MSKYFLISAIFLFICALSGNSFAKQPLAITTSMTSPLSNEDQTGFYDQIVNDATVDRELLVDHLRKEINDLPIKLENDAKYDIVK